jgi:hypothetical protein
VAATRGQAQSPWLQADFSASLSLHASSCSALQRGSWLTCLAPLPVTLCRTLRAMMVGDPSDRIRSSSLPHSPPALDSGLFLVASHNLASPRAVAFGDHDAPGVRAGVDLGATWPRCAPMPRVRGFRLTFLPLSRSTRPPAAPCCADLGLCALLRCLRRFAALCALCWCATLGTAFAALACLTHPKLSTRGRSCSPSTTWRLRVRWRLEITMRQVSALESTWERRGRDARPGPESMASG